MSDSFMRIDQSPNRPPTPSKPDVLADALDRSFAKYVTPGLVRPLFLTAEISVGLVYALNVVTSFIANPFAGFIALIVGAVVSIFAVLAVRVCLEVALAIVQNAMDTRLMREQQVAQVRPTV